MTTNTKTEPQADEAELLADGSVTVDGLKREYGIGRTTAYELMGGGKLPYTMLGARRLIPRRAVARLLAAGMRGLAAASS